MMLFYILAILQLFARSDAKSLRSVGLIHDNQKDQITVDQVQKISHCTDTSSTFPVPEVDDELYNCSWLRDNLNEYENLCDRHEIASRCRVTCGICQDTLEAVELLQACANREGEVEYVQENTSFDCQWLRQHRDVYPDACESTQVALFCPVVCNPFGLGACIGIDPSSTTGQKATAREVGQN